MTSTIKTCSELLRPDLPRAVLLVWSAALLAAIAAAPVAASAARPESWFLYQAFEPFCHQQVGRSWHVQGYPLAVCARCVGLYTGLLLAALLGVRFRAWTIVFALALLGASWAAESTALVTVTDPIRFGTGLALGFCVGAVLPAWAPPANRDRDGPGPQRVPAS
jgi:uncharacterized membrane protein